MCVSQSSARNSLGLTAVALSTVLTLDSLGSFLAYSLAIGFAPVGLAVYALYLVFGAAGRWRGRLAHSIRIGAVMGLIHSTGGWWIAARLGPESVGTAFDAATWGSRGANALVSSLIGAVLGLAGGSIAAVASRRAGIRL